MILFCVVFYIEMFEFLSLLLLTVIDIVLVGSHLVFILALRSVLRLFTTFQWLSFSPLLYIVHIISYSHALS